MKNIFNVKTLYYKYSLDDDWSVRFHMIFRDRRRYQNQWILKSHFSKEHIIIKRAEADEYIEAYNSTPTLIMGFVYNDDYYKFHFSSMGELRFFLDNKDLPT